MANLAYIGSKYGLLNTIDQVLKDHFDPGAVSNLTVADLFSGTGVVGAYMNRRYGCKVMANDTEQFAAGIAKALLQCPYTPKLGRHIDAMNDLTPCEDGALVQEFAVKRKFFTIENASRLQVARQYIKECDCSDLEKEFLLASLITSIDRVANTAAVYASYLKAYKKSALKPLTITPIHTDTAIPACEHNAVQCDDANVFKFESDLSTTPVFLHPPYVARQYSAYYAPLGVIYTNDASNLTGKGAIAPNGYSSPYAKKKEALEAFKQLVERIASKGAKYIFITYGAYGIIPIPEIKTILHTAYPNVHVYNIANRKFKSDATQESVGTVTETWFFGKTNV